MVGNDVVDLADRDADPATLSQRFDARVFSPQELRELAASESPVVLRWSLWAAKEAAYKAAIKSDPSVVFSPRAFRVALDGRRGVVTCSSGRFDVVLDEVDRAVHAVATRRSDDDAPARVVSAVRRLRESASPDELSRAARRLAGEHLARALGVPASTVGIRKPVTDSRSRRSRIPEVSVDGSRAGMDLTLSHHGRVVAFACEIDVALHAVRGVHAVAPSAHTTLLEELR